MYTSSSLTGHSTQGSRNRATIYQFYDERERTPGESSKRYFSCKICAKLVIAGSGTSHLLRHIRNVHKVDI